MSRASVRPVSHCTRSWVLSPSSCSPCCRVPISSWSAVHRPHGQIRSCSWSPAQEHLLILTKATRPDLFQFCDKGGRAPIAQKGTPLDSFNATVLINVLRTVTRLVSFRLKSPRAAQTGVAATDTVRQSCSGDRIFYTLQAPSYSWGLYKTRN